MARDPLEIGSYGLETLGETQAADTAGQLDQLVQPADGPCAFPRLVSGACRQQRRLRPHPAGDPPR